MRKLIIWPGISRRIGACGLTHDGLLRFLNGLRSDLENHYGIYCVLRDEEEPRFFRYLVAFAAGYGWAGSSALATRRYLALATIFFRVSMSSSGTVVTPLA
jgi:hypothetical protein